MDENIPRILIIPYPAQGHINPAVAFAKHLSSKNLLVTLIITTNLRKTSKITNSTLISIDFISDGSEDIDGPESIEAYFIRLEAVFSRNLGKFLEEREISPKVVIYDSTMPWILDVVQERGILGAVFFTQCCAVNAVFYHVKEGNLRFPYEDETVSLPGLPEMEKKDLPSVDYKFVDEKETVVKLLARQWENIERVDWVFCNTFDELENEILEWMKTRCAIKTVGPTILLPAKYEELSDEKNYMVSLFDPKHDVCREWLDSREYSSVAYISFGSVASLGNEQMEELAYGLILSNCYFLWVVRSSEVDKLPQDFTNLASEKGLIVEWCNQPEVLAHRALACFMTHCGWNSTLEGLSNGVPLIAMAQFVDQITNAKFIEDVWKIGVRVKAGESGIIGREEIAACIREVVEGDKGIELKKNVCNLKKLANEAAQEGGSSANNIEDFVSRLVGDKVH